MPPIESIRWSDDGRAVRILDQRLLPEREEYRELRTVEEVRDAIATLSIRGAPAIGIAGAMGMVLALDESATIEALARAHETIRCARPTAVNLSWAVDRMLSVAKSTGLGRVAY